MKIRNNIKRMLCLMLCLCMTFGVLVMAVSCDSEEEGENEIQQEEQKEGEVAVVKVITDIEPGQQLTSENIGIGYAREADIPINAVLDTEKVLEKYAITKLYAGEFVFQGKLSAEDPNANNDKNNNTVVSTADSYIVVTDHIEEGADVAKAVQNLIDKNPGKTLYFPDGTYTFTKSVTTSADPKKTVSFRLSNYAIIKAATNWSGSDAIIRVGASGSSPEEDPTLSFHYMGGIIDGSGRAKGISVEDGRDVLISNVSFKDVVCGIVVEKGSTGYINVDVDNVNIVGASASSATGILVKGSGNTFTNVRVRDVKNGVELTGGGNVLRNVHVTYTGTATDACGFVDSSEGNSYDMCFSEDFATGYRMGNNTVSQYSGCLAFWNKASTQQWAFKADGQFKSVIRNCKVEFDFDNCNGAYLKVTSGGGSGQVLWPVINGSSYMKVNDHSTYLKTYAITNP